MSHSGVSTTVVPPTGVRHVTVAGAVALAALGLGAAVALVPGVMLGALAVAVLVAVFLRALRSFVVWQKLVLFALGGLIVLNYGFANWALLPRFPLPVAHTALLAALLLALQNREPVLAAFLNEPAVIWWLCVVGLSGLHLMLDVPRYGIFAIRDASFVFEGVFMFLGYLWPTKASPSPSPWAALAILFLMNTMYALTFPVVDVLQPLSPVSGLFQRVSLIGTYSHTALFLVVGALYYFLVVQHVTRWPRGLVVGLAALQIGWSFVLQDRSMYIGILLAMSLLMLFGGIRRGGSIAAMLAASLLVFFLIIGVSGTILRGRLGDVGSEFLGQHLRSLLLDPGTPGEGTVEWRLNLWSELRDRVTGSPDLAIFGSGFGEPLIEFRNEADVVVRQPHNTHISVLLRLGIFGALAWFAMLAAILLALLRLLRTSRQMPHQHDFALWFFLFFILAILFTSVQPWLEFSEGAIPFFFLVGAALGLSRTRGEGLPFQPSPLKS